jgi:hypothetical protein
LCDNLEHAWWPSVRAQDWYVGGRFGGTIAGVMTVIYEVRATREGKVYSFGLRPTPDEAEVLLEASRSRVEAVGGRNDRYWVETIDTTRLFELPSKPPPRERYTTRVTQTSPEHAWTTVHVDVLAGDRVVAGYDRNYSILDTFEPFRQGDRDYALIAPHHTATSVMDLTTGDIVAGEEPSPDGFCPVGFYVPDWWDIHDGSVQPGSLYWRDDMEWPRGDFGFVWGCIWGDDSSWKVQYLDLSGVQKGELVRDERFGYVELATHPKLSPRDFIRCSSFDGQLHVEFSILRRFDLATGKPLSPE